MDSKPGSAVANARVYEDFDPHMEWAKEDSSFDTLLVYLPGFLKEKLKIQITSAGKLRISGERAVGSNKWRRFHKEFPLPADCDSNKISAKFEGGILYVKVPKSPLEPASKVPSPPPPKPTDQRPNKPNPDHQTPPPKPDQPKPVPQLPEIAPKPVASNNDSLEKQKSNGIAAKAKDQPAQPLNGHNNPKESVAANNKNDGGDANKNMAGSDKSGGERAGIAKTVSRLGSCKKAISEYRVKSPRALVNLLLAVLFVGVLALYAKNMFKSLGGNNSDSNATHDHHHHDL